MNASSLFSIYFPTVQNVLPFYYLLSLGIFWNFILNSTSSYIIFYLLITFAFHCLVCPSLAWPSNTVPRAFEGYRNLRKAVKKKEGWNISQVFNYLSFQLTGCHTWKEVVQIHRTSRVVHLAFQNSFLCFDFQQVFCLEETSIVELRLTLGLHSVEQAFVGRWCLWESL